MLFQSLTGVSRPKRDQRGYIMSTMFTAPLSFLMDRTTCLLCHRLIWTHLSSSAALYRMALLTNLSMIQPGVLIRCKTLQLHSCSDTCLCLCDTLVSLDPLISAIMRLRCYSAVICVICSKMCKSPSKISLNNCPLTRSTHTKQRKCFWFCGSVWVTVCLTHMSCSYRVTGDRHNAQGSTGRTGCWHLQILFQSTV